jgi:hypothetical protein
MDQYDGGNGGGYPPQGGVVPPQQDGYAPQQQDSYSPQQQDGYVPQQGEYDPQQGGYVLPQQPWAPQVAYAPPQAPPKKKKLWLWIGGAAVIVIAVALVLIFTLGKGGAAENPASPMLYMADGDVYLAVGAESILLEDAAFAGGYQGEELDAWMMPDGSALFYLSGVGSSGEGDLMRIALGSAKAEPERVAQDVYTARIASDGKRILYISDTEEGVGDLYLCTPGGKPEQVDESVWSGMYGFSPNGKLYCYLKEDGKGNQTLMICKGSEPEEVADIDESWASDVYLDDSGRILYDAYDQDAGEYALYLYANGKVDRVSRNASYIAAFGRADEFLYYTGDYEMYYVAGGKETHIADDLYGLNFPGWNSDPRADKEAHCVFGEGESYEEVTMYELSLPGDPVKIGKRSGGFVIDDNFRYCAYVWDNKLYLSRKEGSSWGKREEICESPYDFNIDAEGRYLYYIASDEGYSGDLCRIPLAGGEEEVLLEDATQFLLWKGSVYAVNTDNEAYVVRNERDSEQIEKDITTLYAAEGGIYLGGDNKLYFYNNGEAERVSRSVTSAVTLYGIIGSAEY